MKEDRIWVSENIPQKKKKKFGCKQEVGITAMEDLRQG